MAGDPFIDYTYTGTSINFYSTTSTTTYASSYVITVNSKELEPKEWKLKPHLKFIKPEFKIPRLIYTFKTIPAINNIPNLARNSLLSNKNKLFMK